MFDFNGDGHTDSGEQFIGYQIFKDTTNSMNSNSRQSKPTGRKLEGWEKLCIALVIWQIISLFFGGHH